ncbi:pilus assembly protein TadG-related protein [Ornithinimicrobium cavernae]|uniref:pilus assembly protein TadG-related protein n=1 Tax=Ornithinimicrobium cavernae TaxID=2666047 RepID=UPI000D686768|nr:pilus assembly protein TadG-related protein [Ornithinimicrobium cavernae]
MRRLTKDLRGSGAERGATAILAALLMTALLGAAGLAIDLGASYAKHSELQNGADAAALALAQEYAMDGCTPNSGMATSWVQQNVNNDIAGASAIATCPAANQVKVVADGQQEHWFMPVLGKDSSDITADATVEWGVPSVLLTTPLTISNCAFIGPDGGEPTLGDQLVIWFPNPAGTSDGTDAPGDCTWHGDYPPGGFGVLAHDDCAVTVIEPSEVASGPGSSQLDPCFEDLIGTTQLVPLFTESTCCGSGSTYTITRFAAIELDLISFTSKQYGSGICTGTVPPWTHNNGKNCLVGEFVEFVSLEDAYAEGDLALPGSDDTVIIIRLID